MWELINEHMEVIIAIIVGVIIRFFEKREMKKKTTLMGENKKP